MTNNVIHITCAIVLLCIATANASLDYYSKQHDKAILSTISK